MKKMTKLLMIHWHYFNHETVHFGQLNFLTGKNASGKSTIIDALQVILYGDTSGNFFNKAASGRGNRTLMGYLRGELGDDDEVGFKYLRSGRFSSYIALEFFDDEKNKCFTAGCCFDIYSENDTQKLFFSYDDALPDHEFVQNNVPMSIQSLRSFLKSNYTGDSYTTDVGRDFRMNLYGKLGGLREQFKDLLKKAVSFNPNVDIQQFITDFVCNNQQTVDVSQMQDNIRSYKQLENEADILQSRLTLLERVSDAHQSYERYMQDALLYSYLIDKAKSDIEQGKLTSAKLKQEALKKQLAGLTEIIEAESARLGTLQKERDALQVQLSMDEQAQAIKAIEDQIAEKEQLLVKLTDEYNKALITLSKGISSWNGCLNILLQKLEQEKEITINPLLASRIADIRVEARELCDKTAPLLNLDAMKIEQTGKECFMEYSAVASTLRNNAVVLYDRIGAEQQMLSESRTSLQGEQQTLERGIYQFSKDVIDLKDAISSKLRVSTGSEVPVVIVAEAAEIKNERWRNAVEGYLHTQKFYLIVPPEHFKTAIKVFDSIKREKSIYGTGIVDIEKLQDINPTADAGSLAEEIESQNEYVQLFLNFTLGKVKKCDRVTDLRRSRTAITDEGMLYQNFVVRAIHPNRFSRPAIGQNAVKQRLEKVKCEIVELTQQITSCATVKVALDQTRSIAQLSETETANAVFSAKNMSQVPTLRADISQLNISRDAIDVSAVAALKEHIATLEETMKRISASKDTHMDERSTQSERLRVCTEETIPELEDATSEKQTHLSVAYEIDWVQEIGGLRYERELSSRGNADAIEQAFPRELSRANNATNATWDDLQGYRREYNTQYKMGYNVKMLDNQAYDDALRELSENKLPEYIERIKDTRDKAFEQFREDFLSRLEHNINDAKQQIDGLNSALKGRYFGEESFRFLIVPKPEYKRYYDMIVDPMKLEGGYNLFSNQFNTKYKEEISELFAIITNENVSSKSGESEDYDKRVRAFTDYRTYLSFDLESANREGEAQRLSKTMGKKSGGETQTPFYIAVLASFAQLYRVGRDKKSSTIRLIIFDEAFSKMDGERISRSVELLKELNFQAILSAPPDKIGDIAPHVDSNICVLREGKQACVRSFDANEIEELNYE